jgi:hypothetical protein
VYGWISVNQHLEVNMSNNKQTSLDWFLDELLQLGYIKRLPVTELQQAKAMHKEEIINAFDEGQEYEYQYHINSTPKFDSETYYKETFGGNNEQQ